VWTTYGSPGSEVAPAGSPGTPGATYPANPPSDSASHAPEPFPPGLPREAADFDTETGRLVLADGWQVVETVETPITEPAGGETPMPSKSVGLAITDGQHEQWVLLWWHEEDGGSSAASWTNQRGGFTSLQSWLDYRVAVETRGATDQLVSMRADGTLEPLNGVRLLEQRRTPTLDGVDSQTVAARVKVLNEQWYVLAVRTDDTTTYYPVSYPLDGDPDTLDGFVQYVEPLVRQGSYR
jgi:hypothetical protein